MAWLEYQVTGMTCGHCEMSVREEVGEINGVDDVRVSAASGKLVLSVTSDVDDSRVLGAVADAGYSAVRVS